ncbi:DUF2058 domain-containing protein [Candidatus Venteria ishoeyi]|uniref:DUF2058 domain-containing protein n=1 Tax=Candidatus Venteria ishoeyi TaxID=1899563 RepID=UPI0025A4E3DF|nr:DUF2058 domain-containing protein [Candidatus Venteria ishoeyi]MDM8546503.1 DUF2058 domain-containing protein [Candidatus Venteria ishoeyi]
MGNAFQDQFLKLGLTDQKKVKKLKHEQRKKNKTQQTETTPAAKQQAAQLQAERVEQDRLLNQQKQQQAQAKAIQAQIRQLITQNRQTDTDGELVYHFVDGKKVKQLYVSQKILAQLSQDKLYIVKFDEQYALVKPDIAEKIRTRDANIVIQHNTEQNVESEEMYADYKIPDDLMW